MRTLTFWQNTPSIHQAPLLREVAQKWDGKIRVVTEEDVQSQRVKQGWFRPNFGAAELIVAPSRGHRDELLMGTAAPEDIHVFSGFHAYPETYRSFRKATTIPARLGVIAEPGRGDDGMKAYLRRLRYMLHAKRWGRRLDFILATGELGVQWYCRSGFSPEKVHPFGYFVDMPVAATAGSRRRTDHRAQLLFVGQLISRKGLDLLLQSLACIGSSNWHLTVIGSGPDEAILKNLSRKLGIDTKTSWLGNLPNPEVGAVMNRCDCLVLASRFDGWGAVINEALMAGTRVIASDACGASELLRNSLLGCRTPAGDADSLTNALREVVQSGVLPVSVRQRVRHWAEQAISPNTVANYLIAVVEGTRFGGSAAVAPWRLQVAEENGP